MAGRFFSFTRMWAMVFKEFVQMRRDRLTFGMLVGIPLMQLILFGYAINSDPKSLHTAVISADQGSFGRSLIWAMKNSDYFKMVKVVEDERLAEEMLATGQVQFVFNIPVNFSRDLVAGRQPSLLMQADATDPAAVGNAMAAISKLAENALSRDLAGALAYLQPNPPPLDLIVHRKYNPEGISQYNIVPGLMGVVLTMTLVIITGLAITRERERGTMENLLTTPVKPLEVMVGKITPYILMGYIQMGLIVTAAHFIFGVPLLGSLGLLFAVSLIFIAANQLQAVQMAFFFFLPSILLSGFMFPFRGMPEWAQWVGSVLPLTHYLRVVRGILLKGNGLDMIWIHLWPIALFAVVVLAIALKRYRQTLD